VITKKLKSFTPMKFDVAYKKAMELVQTKELPKFRIEGKIIYIKKLSKKEFNLLKTKWKKHFLCEIPKITEDNLYNSGFCQDYLDYQIANDNPAIKIKQWFYQTMNDISDFQTVIE
jgi:hypothetical protein